ncbi:LytTR family transcriptional regulator [Mucilaginibacter daejeonensis]|uniref:LytR/AlgR family response regulator transcription factor n=1 Tax=Mucilaginibacter daejeonensis TaxID=398049 RepID=UPI001D174D7A|nr:LytTR family DNA-binding domain-containing protein [Mucilaginibacter daejeonensis]UEG54020.1 LytTR family transcriptional regulator [Mucilaginibacter daejeonensis]
MAHQKLMISQQDNIFLIEPSKIIFIQSDSCYTKIYLKGGQKILACKPLSKLERELQPDIFIRVNQSFLINRYLIERIDKKRKSIELNENHSVSYTVALKALLKMIEA